PGKIHSAHVKHYQATSYCTCCRNMNKNYITEKGKICVPDIKNPLDGEQIKYSVGGLRSKTPEETMRLIDETLEKLELDIEIEVDQRNPFADIIPVYHSTLEMTHKNKSPYFFGEQHSHGKGINKRQAYFSASFEMFERLSARYFGEKEMIRGSYKELGNLCADISSMTKIVKGVNTVYEQFDSLEPIDWVWGYSLTGECPKLIPASLVYLSRNYYYGNFAPIGSSGMSAGATIKDAILQGLFELIEHDAWMIGQANTVRLPIVKYDGLHNKELGEVIEKIRAKGFRVISRDYTNTIGIPVIRTWISNPNDYANYAFSGFGASIDPEIALERSVTEAVQSRASVHEAEVDEYCSPDMEYLISARDGLFSLFYFEQKDIKPIGKQKDISEMPCYRFRSVDESIRYVIGKIRNAIPNAEVLYVDLTRKGIGVPVVKVFITKGTQLMGEPLLVTSDRLYSFQKDMGYSEQGVNYDELYLAPYPH
ncbi:MAG: YcaO-like family protein, partial [Acetatifactor sp.]|nr:YcaO-like family protein [Acetatifactor sp.]